MGLTCRRTARRIRRLKEVWSIIVTAYALADPDSLPHSNMTGSHSAAAPLEIDHCGPLTALFGKPYNPPRFQEPILKGLKRSYALRAFSNQASDNPEGLSSPGICSQ